MSENIESSNQQGVPGYEEFAMGLTLIVWAIASSIILGGLSQSGGYDANAFASIGIITIVILTPFGSFLFASGFAKILKNTRS